jgi:hypothetical protein
MVASARVSRWSSQTLAARIAQGEGRTLEFKRGLPRDEKTARTLAAFANTRGGVLLIGVGDRREVLGAPRPRETLRRLRAIASSAIEPPLAVELELVELDGRPIVVCEVAVSKLRPHAIVAAPPQSRIVVRAGSSNRAAEGATLRALSAAGSSKRSLSELEQRVLEWVRRACGNGTARDSQATVSAFCGAQNIGRQRARRAFLALERRGDLVGHGPGSRRSYSIA